MIRMCIAIVLAAALPASAAEQSFTIAEPFGLAWGPDRVNYPVAFPPGQVTAQGVSLNDAVGKPVPVQLSEIELWPDGKSVRKAVASFMVSLAPDQTATWKLTAGTQPVQQPAGEVRGQQTDNMIELSNAKTGIRLVGRNRSRIRSRWRARKCRRRSRPCGCRTANGSARARGRPISAAPATRAEITDNGPVFARAKLRYDFEGGKFYAATVELNAGQDLAVVSEEYNLSEGQRYPMTGVDGMKPEERYAYVVPKFDNPDKALMWDWWGQTMAKLPTPNAYTFSFSEGLQPDSADFHGRSQYGNLSQGDGGLKYDKDGRFAYLNAYLQWGDEETLYLGLWNAKEPAQQIAFVALRPSEWLHPDIDPHPSTILKQYVQTTCPTFERRTSGDVFLRAPVCLGKRVYGLGGVERTLAKQVLPERSGPVVSEKEQWGSNLMLRHIRLGSVELDRVRNWIVRYDETGKVSADVRARGGPRPLRVAQDPQAAGRGAGGARRPEGADRRREAARRPWPTRSPSSAARCSTSRRSHTATWITASTSA